MASATTWGGLQNMGDGVYHDYMAEGGFGIMGNDYDGWQVVFAPDGIEYDAGAARFPTADEAREEAIRCDASYKRLTVRA